MQYILYWDAVVEGAAVLVRLCAIWAVIWAIIEDYLGSIDRLFWDCFRGVKRVNFDYCCILMDRIDAKTAIFPGLYRSFNWCQFLCF